MAEKYKSKFTGSQIDNLLTKVRKLSGDGVKIGTVTTAPAGTSASVEAVSSGADTILNFVIPKGDEGVKGDKGDTGATGAKGDKGDTGADGYTPVRGVDYWTDADKAEIESDVNLAAAAANAAAASTNAAAAAAAAEPARANQSFANALRGSAGGSAVALTDVSPVAHTLGVTVRSKNMIPYPYKETTKTQNGVTFTDNGDGTITVNTADSGASTYTSFKFFEFEHDGILLKESVRLSGTPKGGAAGTYRIMARCLYNGATKYFVDSGNGVTIPMRYTLQAVYIQVNTGVAVSNAVFKPQLERGAAVTEYTPYTQPETVSVKRCGKNLFDPNIFIDYCMMQQDSEGAYYGDSDLLQFNYVDCFVFAPNTQYAISFYGKASSTEYPGVSVRFDYTDGTNSAYGSCEINETNYTKHTVVSSAGKSIAGISFSYGSGIIVSYIKDFMLEIGGTPTEYEPYAAEEYAPAADGTVGGVTSLYPRTTLMTDMKGAILEVGYNRDMNRSGITIYINADGYGCNPSDGSTYALSTVYAEIRANPEAYRFFYVGSHDMPVCSPISVKVEAYCIQFLTFIAADVENGMVDYLTGYLWQNDDVCLCVIKKQ